MYYHCGKWKRLSSSEVTNVLSLWEVEEVVLFSEVTNVLHYGRLSSLQR